MLPRTSRELLDTVRPVLGIVAGWAVVVLFSEFGIENVGYHEPFGLVWWLGTLTTIAATVVAAAAVLVFVISHGIALGVGTSDGRFPSNPSTDG
jgi:hypothetical protein